MWMLNHHQRISLLIASEHMFRPHTLTSIPEFTAIDEYALWIHYATLFFQQLLATPQDGIPILTMYAHTEVTTECMQTLGFSVSV